MQKIARYYSILKKVQVNVPFLKLKNDYLPLFMEYGMNPEIGIDAVALDSVSDKAFEDIAEVLKINKRKITVIMILNKVFALTLFYILSIPIQLPIR